MRPGLLLVGAFATVGCDQLFGISTIAIPMHDAATQDLGMVHGHYTQLWAENAADSTAVELTREYPAAQLTAIATLDDGSPRPVMIDDTGFSFTTPLVGDHYSLRFQTASQARTFDLAATQLELVERTTKRPTDPPAPGGTKLTLNLSQRHPENAAKEELVTTGTWTRHQVLAAAPLTLDLSTPDSNGVVIDMLTPHDAAYYTASATVGPYVQLMYAANVGEITTVAGATTTVPTLPATPQPVQTTACANVLIHGSEETARETLAVGTGTPVTGWSVNADPGLQLALVAGFPLAYGLGTGSGAPVTAMYGNPYGLTRIDAMALTYVQSPAGAISSVTEIDAAAGCSATTELVAGQVALASNVRLGDIALTANLQLVMVPKTGTVDVAFDVSSDGTADYHVVHLDQIVAASYTTLEEVVTTDHVVHLPASRFLTTNTYRIRVDTMLGYPGAKAGDFMTATEPAAISQFVTPLFRPES